MQRFAKAKHERVQFATCAEPTHVANTCLCGDTCAHNTAYAGPWLSTWRYVLLGWTTGEEFVTRCVSWHMPRSYPLQCRCNGCVWFVFVPGTLSYPMGHKGCLPTTHALTSTPHTHQCMFGGRRFVQVLDLSHAVTLATERGLDQRSAMGVASADIRTYYDAMDLLLIAQW